MQSLEEMKEQMRDLYGGAAMSEREVALHEKELWAYYSIVAKAEGKQILERRDWFSREFGASKHSVDVRSVLLGYGPNIDVLWERIDAKTMSLAKARDLALTAKRKAQVMGGEFKDYLAEELKRHDNVEGKYEVTLPSGIKSYRRPPVRKESLPEVPKSWNPDVKTSREFAAYLRSLTDKFVNERLKGQAEPSVLKELARDFEFEVRMSYEDLLRKIDRIKRGPNPDAIASITRQKVIRACEALEIEPPRHGEAVDMIEAKRSYRRLSATYHPDKTGNDVNLTAQFNLIQSAWKVLQDYSEARK